MDSAKLNDWLQVFGMFALVASLIFVGLQIRQTQEIAITDAANGYLEPSLTLKQLLIDNADVWQKGCMGEDLSAVDQSRVAHLFRAYIEFAYFTWLGGRSGVFQGDGSQTFNRFAANIHRYPGIAQMVESHQRWAEEGESYNAITVRLFTEEVFARVAELGEIESKQEIDPRWCGL